ncbi:MAG: CRISPR-associated protein Cas4 [Terriglobales bacterium]
MSSLLPLRVHDLKQWAYCRRIVFYNHVMPVDKKTTYKMEYGRIAEEAIDKLEKRRKLSEFGIGDGKRHFHVWCSSECLGLSGKLDLLIESDAGLFPVDFKASEQAVHNNHIVQLCGYALLLEERFRCLVERGFIFLIPPEEIVAAEITSERKQSTLALLDQIRDSIVREATPDPTEVRARCENCEYQNYCGDIF